MIEQADFDRLVAKGHLDAEDVLFLRRAMYGDDCQISIEEADALFRLDASCSYDDKSWVDFFIEAITDHALNQQEPRGYLTSEMTEWLIERISSDGRVQTGTELELVIKILDVAIEVPANFSAYVMEQVKQAVLSGEGPTRSGEMLEKGRIGRGEVDLLRRVLYACGGSNGIAVSREEAQMLFDINDAVTDVANDASWPDLFVKAISNYLMSARGYLPLSREEALRRAAWLDSAEHTGVGAFFGRMVSGGLHGVLDALHHEEEPRHEQKRSMFAADEHITELETDWLVERLHRDGALSATEKALLLFIKQISPNVHPRLTPLLAQVA